MLRRKSDRELFLFVMNIGGEGSGEVRLGLPGTWKLTDALSGAPLPQTTPSRLPLSLKAWEYRVVRLAR